MTDSEKKFSRRNKKVLLILILLFLVLLFCKLLNGNPINNVGTAGTDGQNGAQGETGLSGNDGLVGKTGENGNTGLNGAAGNTGNNGLTGEAGQTGTIGLTGATGLSGQNGTAGSVGSTGISGQNGSAGAISLIKITSEGTGVNCGNAGKKIESGIDSNINNILDINEISATNYVCNGLTGLIGPAGQNGAQGQVGASGTNASIGYGYIYNLSVRSVALDAPIIFDSNGPLFGITHTVGTSAISISNSGIYSINFIISGVEPNQFTIFINGVASSSTIYGSGSGTQQNRGQTILDLQAGDVITIVNDNSTSSITLTSTIGGTGTSVNASILIERLD